MKVHVSRGIPLKNRIGAKFTGLLSLLILLALLPFSGVVFKTVNSFGAYSSSINEQQIRQQATDYLLGIARERGQKYEEYLNRANTAVTLMSRYAENIYNHLAEYGKETENELMLERQETNNMFISPPERSVATVYWGGESVTEKVREELQALNEFDAVLIQTKKLFAECQATHLISASGIGKYYTWNSDSEEVLRHLPPAEVFDLRNGEPFTIFSQAGKPTDSAQWTGIYKDDVIEGLMITASGAITDKNGVFRGITGIDLPLRKIVDDLLVKEKETAQVDSQVLFSFLVDSKGQIIAFPIHFLAKFGYTVDLLQLQNSADIISLNLLDSKLEAVSGLKDIFAKNNNSFHELELEGEKYYLANQQLPSLGWTFALVAKQADLLSSITKSRAALKSAVGEIKTGFLLNLFVIGAFALVVAFLAINYLMAPLLKIAGVAQAVGKGDLSASCEAGRADEIGALGGAMNDMIEQLRAAEEFKATYLSRLKNEIEARTQDLDAKNVALQAALSDLSNESEKRHKVSLALQESEKQLRSIMVSSLTSLCIIQKGRFRFVNEAFSRMFGYSQEELIQHVPLVSLLPKAYQEPVSEALEAISRGQDIKLKWPYHIKCRRHDGSIFDAQVEAAKMVWDGKPAVVATIIDISPLKRTEHKLLVNERRLRDSLEEKNILLREIYHRTKNNMLVIISMLHLQMDGIRNEQVKKIFTEIENRIRAMALVHESLYRSKNLAEINLGEYLTRMTETLVANMTYGNTVKVSSKCCTTNISFEKAIPVGLIVNELVTNSLTHAFVQGEEGRISLELKRVSRGIDLIVADNGIGIPENVDPHSSTTFGMQITANMIELQLGATFEVDCSFGTEYRIHFPQL
jgi:PAS domain S-box-containing protein